MKQLLYFSIISVILAITQPAFAREDENKNNENFLFWANYGLGIHQKYGGNKSSSEYCDQRNNGFTMFASATTYIPSFKYIFTIRASANTNIIDSYYDDSEFLYEGGIMIGQMRKNRWAYASFAAGLSYIQGGHSGETTELLYEGDEFYDPEYDYEMVYYRTIGIPIQIELMVTPLKFCGMGIIIFGNLNIERPFYGAVLSFSSGRLF
ncbi:MAG: hypothetical protein PF637_04155 [Spirochaetes bacterium]|jgi:hypothetical protein|nr:hypothetical protein [Spirochaetota bacterium]